jgi:hypothetical protein
MRWANRFDVLCHPAASCCWLAAQGEKVRNQWSLNNYPGAGIQKLTAPPTRISENIDYGIAQWGVSSGLITLVFDVPGRTWHFGAAAIEDPA